MISAVVISTGALGSRPISDPGASIISSLAGAQEWRKRTVIKQAKLPFLMIDVFDVKLLRSRFGMCGIVKTLTQMNI